MQNPSSCTKPTPQKSYWNAPTQKVQDAYDALSTDEIVKLVAQARGLNLEEYKEKDGGSENGENRSEKDGNEKAYGSVYEEQSEEKVIERRIEIVDAESGDEDQEGDDGNEDEEENEEEEDVEMESPVSSPEQDLAWIYENDDDDEGNGSDSNNENEDEEEDVEDIFAEPETLNTSTPSTYHDPYDNSSNSNNKSAELSTSSKSFSIFTQMLNDPQHKVNPFSTWDREYHKFVDDLRYGELDSLGERKMAFERWSVEEIKKRNERSTGNTSKSEYSTKNEKTTSETAEDSAQEQEERLHDPEPGSKPTPFSINTSDPSIQFLSYVLQNFKKKKHPYYIDFKRKFRQDPEFSAPPLDKLSDKEKENLFRGMAVWAKRESKEERKGVVVGVLKSYVDKCVEKEMERMASGGDGNGNGDNGDLWEEARKRVVKRLLNKSQLPVEILREPKFYALNQKQLEETIDEFVKENS